MLEALVETYAPRCDGFLAASNQTNLTLGAANVLHAGPEMYGNFWQKVRSIYRNGFDCFHIDEFDESRYHPLTVEYHATWKRRDRAPALAPCRPQGRTPHTPHYGNAQGRTSGHFGHDC